MIKKILAILAFSLLSLTSIAQTPLNIVTASGAGSIADTALRYFAPALEKELGRPVVIHNIPGGQGLVGVRAYIDMPADGNHILAVGTQLAYIAAAMPQNNIDTLNIFEPLHGLAYTPQQIMVASSSNIKSVSDLQELSKKKGFITGGSAHPSTQSSMMLLDKSIGTTTQIIGYKQTAQLATETAGGFVDYTVGGKGNGATSGLIDAGLLRVIGYLKDHDVEEFSWNAIFIHPKAPETEKKKIYSAFYKVLRSQEASKFHQDRLLIGPDAIKSIMLREYKLIQKTL